MLLLLSIGIDGTVSMFPWYTINSNSKQHIQFIGCHLAHVHIKGVIGQEESHHYEAKPRSRTNSSCDSFTKISSFICLSSKINQWCEILRQLNSTSRTVDIHQLARLLPIQLTHLFTARFSCQIATSHIYHFNCSVTRKGFLGEII